MTTPDPDRLTILGPSGADEREALWFEFLRQTYVQRADARQREMGLTYTTAETHDLARIIAGFEATERAALASSEARLRELLGKARAQLYLLQRGPELRALLTDIDAALGPHP